MIDEYGDIQGLVTIDDILEEIVGDFTTSIDVDLDEEIIKQKDGSFIIDGQTTIRDLNKELDAELDTSGQLYCHDNRNRRNIYFQGQINP